MIAGLALLLAGACLLMPVNAEADYSETMTDPTGDLTGTQNDDIDITRVTSKKVSDEIIFEITVVGEFDNYSVNINFFVDGDKYLISDSNMSGSSLYGPGNSFVNDTGVEISGGVGKYTISASDVVATTSFKIGEVTLTDSNFVVDFVGSNDIDADDDDADDDKDEDDKDEGDSPGFGLIVISIAVIIAVAILFNKRKV